MSAFNFIYAQKNFLLDSFSSFDKGCEDLIKNNLPLPAYELCIKASHVFNLLDARGLISVTERQAYILKIRSLVQKCCNLILENNE